jgi:putative transposase
MPRLARAVAVDCAHHIVQRGNNRHVFFVDEDKRVYLEILGEECDKYGLEVGGGIVL